MKNSNLIKISIICSAFLGFLGCQREEIFQTDKHQELTQKISLNEVKLAFEQKETEKLAIRKLSKDDYYLELTPNWKTFEQEGAEDTHHCKVETNIFNSSLKGELIFLKLGDSLKQYLLMQRIDSISPIDNETILNARFYFFETDGKLFEAYKMEGGKIAKQLHIPKLSKTSRGTECSGYITKVVVSEMDEWGIGCNRGGGGGSVGMWKEGDDVAWWEYLSEVEVVGKPKKKNTWLSSWVYMHSFYDRVRNPRPSALSGAPRHESDINGGGGGGTPSKTKSKADDKIEDKLTNKCAKEILAKLPNLKNDIAKLLNDTFGGNSPYDITFMEDETLRGTDIDGQANASNATKISEDKIVFKGNIYLNPDILENATQEYILVTMYHEVIHAFLNYEETRLRGKLLPNEKYDNSEFERKYPDVKIVELEYGNKNKVKKYQLLQDEKHNKFAPFIEKLAQSIISFNPKIPLKTARAMAKMGIVDEKSMSDEEKQLSEYQRKGTDPRGTKCN